MKKILAGLGIIVLVGMLAASTTINGDRIVHDLTVTGTCTGCGGAVSSVNGLTGAVLSPTPFGFQFKPIVDANWTTIGSGGSRTSTATNGPSGGPTIAITTATGGSGSIYGVTASVAPGDFTRYAQFWSISPLAVNFTSIGFGVTDGTRVESAQIIYINSSGTAFRSGATTALAAGTYTAANGDTNNVLLIGAAGGVWNTPITFKINRTGTTYTGSYSLNGGMSYINVFVDTTPYLTADRIIVFGDARGGAVSGSLLLFSCSDGSGNAC